MNIEKPPKIIRSPIISCSRRTDIPAFLMDWLIDMIKIGYVDVVNPYNKNQISRISLKPSDVKCWVFWSKNFKNFIEAFQSKNRLFNQYNGYYFQFTINSPSELERNVKISLEERFKQLEWLLEQFGDQSVSFRFDPIILYKDQNSKIIKSNLEKFEYIVKSVASLGINEMIFSFATLYSKVKKRMRKRNKVPIELSFQKKKEILTKLLQVCNKNNIKMKACCQPELVQIEGIEQAHCIDAYKIEKITGYEIPKIKDTGQRENCGCYKSRDIGGYDGIFRCKHDCDYCYASPRKE
ncbi:MAG: DUF1848 family protein [Promethearchaeota archaeon]